MARTRKPLARRQSFLVPSAGLSRDPSGPAQRSGPQAGERPPAAANAPVIVLTHSLAGGRRLQGMLERVPALACTTGTGILGMCDTAARAWANVEESDGEHMSSLAAKSMRAMVASMITVMVTRSGARRWCESATAEPAAAEAFLRVVPGTQFICLHRSCPDVVRSVLRSSPWGIIGGRFTPYLQAHPTNATVAIAACWADFTRQLLDFESRHPESSLRVRYEDLLSDPVMTSEAISDFIGLAPESPVQELAEDELMDGDAGGGEEAGQDSGFPVAMLPPRLIQRVNQLHEQLDYPRMPASS
jgi:Sulfotransferase family